jgi:hypothetical protein
MEYMCQTYHIYLLLYVTIPGNSEMFSCEVNYLCFVDVQVRTKYAKKDSMDGEYEDDMEDEDDDVDIDPDAEVDPDGLESDKDAEFDSGDELFVNEVAVDGADVRGTAVSVEIIPTDSQVASLSDSSASNKLLQLCSQVTNQDVDKS